MTKFTIHLYEDRYFETTCWLFNSVSEFYQIGELPTLAQTREYVQNQVLGNDSDVKIALAIEANKAIGAATFSVMYPSPKSKAQLYIKELFIDAAHRNRGAGRALMKFVARYALDHGCNRMDWSAEKTNPTAVEFYNAIGAKPLSYKIYYRIADEDLESFANE